MSGPAMLLHPGRQCQGPVLVKKRESRILLGPSPEGKDQCTSVIETSRVQLLYVCT